MYDDSEDNHLMHWEIEAQNAIERLVKEISYDYIQGVVCLPSFDPANSHSFPIECADIEELENYLMEVYNHEWYANVPFDGGEAVFLDDALGAVQDLLADNSEVQEFFDAATQPTDSETLVTANELLIDANASKIVRVSLDEITDELIKYLAAHPQKLRELSPQKFEELIADMWRNQGFDVKLTPRSNDGGIDVIAVQRSNVGTVMVIIQCKRYAETNKVGVEVVRGLYGVVEQKRATQGIIATTSFFTRQAQEFGRTVPYRIGLGDFDVLKSEIIKWRDRIGGCP